MQAFQEFSAVVQTYMPNILLALAILAIGLLIAWIAAAIARAVLKRTGLHRHMKQYEGEGMRADDVARWVGALAFVLVLVLVLVPVFNALNLPAISEPFDDFLGSVIRFVPRIISAAILALMGWAAATIAKIATEKGLRMIGADEFLRREGAPPGATDRTPSIARSLGNAAFFFVLLLFLPAILGTLELEGILEPVQGMMDVVLAALPRILAAAIILVAGLFAARIVQQLVKNLAAAAGIDALGARMGMSPTGVASQIPAFLGYAAYAFVALPVAVAALNALQLEEITRPFSAMLQEITAALPNIIAAALILVLASIIGRFVGTMAENLARSAGVDSWMGAAGARPGSPHVPEPMRVAPSKAIGTLVMATIVLLAAMEAANLLQFELLNVLIGALVVFLGRVALGVIILAVGFFVARMVSDIVRRSGAPQSGMLSGLTNVVILLFSVALAIQQLGIGEGLVNLVVGLTLGAVAVAAAIAFGMGGREPAKRMLERWTGSSGQA